MIPTFQYTWTVSWQWSHKFVPQTTASLVKTVSRKISRKRDLNKLSSHKISGRPQSKLFSTIINILPETRYAFTYNNNHSVISIFWDKKLLLTRLNTYLTFVKIFSKVLELNTFATRNYCLNKIKEKTSKVFFKKALNLFDLSKLLWLNSKQCLSIFVTFGEWGILWWHFFVV